MAEINLRAARVPLAGRIYHASWALLAAHRREPPTQSSIYARSIQNSHQHLCSPRGSVVDIHSHLGKRRLSLGGDELLSRRRPESARKVRGQRSFSSTPLTNASSNTNNHTPCPLYFKCPNNKLLCNSRIAQNKIPSNTLLTALKRQTTDCEASRQSHLPGTP